MKKHLLPVVFLICFSGVANAQCAWVLWAKSEFRAKEDKDSSYIGWYIVGAFPTVNACREDEEAICMSRKEFSSQNIPDQNPHFKPKDVKCFESWGGHTMSWYNESGNWISEWKCLPDTVDPRK